MNREELLKKYEEPIKVLGHGHVRLIDVMGDDERIEAAARLSYQKGTRKRSETRGLLRYLMRHRHSTPFEKCVIELDMKLPIFLARQYVRHRMQSINELSGRYSELPEEFYIPEPDQICHQSRKNKQGRAEPVDEATANHIRSNMRALARDEFKNYHWLLNDDGQGNPVDPMRPMIARETARINLPLSTYTQWNTTMNLHNLFHFLGLRMDSHAQWEARQFANVIAEIVKDWVPLAWEAFEDYRLHAVTFSRQEMQALMPVLRVAEVYGGTLREILRQEAAEKGLSKREVEEFLTKLPGLDAVDEL